MLQEHVKLMSLLQHVDEVLGRKKLQKIIFIAKKFNYPFYEKYDFHFYGPYSEEVTLKIEELVNLGLVIEKQETLQDYVQYRYTLSQAGEQFLQNFDVELVGLADFVEVINKKSARFLELVSTILYFDTLEKAEIKQKIPVVKEKQHYTENEIDEAFQFIATLTPYAQELS